MTNKETIERIFETHLDQWLEKGLNQRPFIIETEMLAPIQDENEWQCWIPIKSKVSDEDLIEFEKEIGFL